MCLLLLIRGGHDAGQVARLLLVPADALAGSGAYLADRRHPRSRGLSGGRCHRWRPGARCLVDADELDVRVRLGGDDGVGAGREADGHDDVVLLVDERLDVLGDVAETGALGRLAGPGAPILVAPSWVPSQEYWLKFWSLSVPTSVTSPILRFEVAPADAGAVVAVLPLQAARASDAAPKRVTSRVVVPKLTSPRVRNREPIGLASPDGVGPAREPPADNGSRSLRPVTAGTRTAGASMPRPDGVVGSIVGTCARSRRLEARGHVAACHNPRGDPDPEHWAPRYRWARSARGRPGSQPAAGNSRILDRCPATSVARLRGGSADRAVSGRGTRRSRTRTRR